MQGVMFILEQCGQTLMARDQQIAKLTAELDAARAQLAEITGGRNGDAPSPAAGAPVTPSAPPRRPAKRAPNRDR